MLWRLLSVHDGLASFSRLRSPARDGQGISVVELCALIAVGVGAAWSAASVDLPELIGSATGIYLQVPGNAIIRTFLPLSLGVALVPRRLAASFMSAIAVFAALALNQFGLARVGDAAMTNLASTGPLLDAALWGAQSVWRLHGGFLLTGLSSNLLAYGVRAFFKHRSGQRGGMIFADWKWTAGATFPVCGAVVGLVCALIWFRFRRKVPPDAAQLPA